MLAAGEGRRSGHHTNKVLLPLAGRGVFTWSIESARRLATVTHTVLVIREDDREAVMATLDREVAPPEVAVVVGGDMFAELVREYAAPDHPLAAVLDRYAAADDL
jgi:2-C-methyl-D-erythritol 4-phosphate cytidylyltransferase